MELVEGTSRDVPVPKWTEWLRESEWRQLRDIVMFYLLTMTQYCYCMYTFTPPEIWFWKSIDVFFVFFLALCIWISAKFQCWVNMLVSDPRTFSCWSFTWWPLHSAICCLFFVFFFACENIFFIWLYRVYFSQIFKCHNKKRGAEEELPVWKWHIPARDPILPSKPRSTSCKPVGFKRQLVNQVFFPNFWKSKTFLSTLMPGSGHFLVHGFL